MAHPQSGSLSTIPDWIGFGNFSFWGEGNTGVYLEKKNLSEQGEKTSNKLNPHITPGPGFEPGPRWWEASALTTAPSLLRCNEEFEIDLPFGLPQFPWFYCRSSSTLYVKLVVSALLHFPYCTFGWLDLHCDLTYTSRIFAHGWFPYFLRHIWIPTVVELGITPRCPFTAACHWIPIRVWFLTYLSWTGYIKFRRACPKQGLPESVLNGIRLHDCRR